MARPAGIETLPLVGIVRGIWFSRQLEIGER